MNKLPKPFSLSDCENNSDGFFMCQTVIGLPVRLICINAHVQDPTNTMSYFPIIGLVTINNQKTERTIYYKLDGSCTVNKDYNLVNIPVKRKLIGFVNIYENPKSFGEILHLDREKANINANENRIACVDISKFNIEYIKGEGLE